MAVRTLHNELVSFVHLLVCHFFLDAGASRDFVLFRKAAVDEPRSKLEVRLVVPYAAAVDDLMDHRIENGVRIRVAAKSLRQLDNRSIWAAMAWRSVAPDAADLLIVEDADRVERRHWEEVAIQRSHSVSVRLLEKLRQSLIHRLSFQKDDTAVRKQNELDISLHH